MNDRNYILAFLFTFSALFSLSQKSYTLKGKVISPTGEPIEDARLNISTETKNYVRTDKKGQYSLTFYYNKPVELIINHVGYAQKRIVISKSLIKKSKNNIVEISIKLNYRSLPDHIVYSKYRPDTVFSSELTSVSDYEFIGENMVLLTYSKSLNKNAFLQLTSRKNKLITTYRTPDNPKRLFKDFEGRLYLITEKKVFNISIYKNEFRLRPIDKERFYKLTAKIIDTCNNHFLYSDFNDAYPAFNYYAQKLKDTIPKVLHHVENSFMMDLYRAEYKYAPSKQKLWAFRKEIKTGIDKEIWIGAANFTKSLYYEPLYAPLFVNNDTILIFDHYSDQLIKVNNEFKKIDSIPIFYHKNKDKKNWEQPILKDKEENKLYGLFLKHGFHYLKPIDLNKGSTLISFKLNYRYVENVKVENGYVYYIYRPYESSQKKFLYREVINTEIEEN